MNEEPKLPEYTEIPPDKQLEQSIVKQIVGDVTAEEMQRYVQYNDIQNQSYITQTLLDAFADTQNNEIEMRKTVAKGIMRTLFSQIFIGLGIIIAVGLGYLNFADNWLMKTVFMGMLAEVTTIVAIVVNNLFPKTTSNNLENLTNLLEKMQNAIRK